ncbi:HlyD family secretion protein [Psychromonas sp. Urea-02u-13]|uniref:HlyD family secretion protein n=1 Tax=Psychromonas sp. Urea-02u-13 TaxID=2058326 RepID=UPI000C33F4B9|nr:HlyD family secretion protein [Psychromonas sp. Urea-02u-13]PKG40049.1 HlyD family secretion protein [Psychromonas sp. Urea-02u-13]
MDLILVLTYTAICVAIFKIFKIPLNKWTVPTAVLGGIILIGTLIMLMNYNHPYSETSREYFVSTPVVPAVRGKVISVNVEANVPIKKGHLLFTIDPVPFQNKVDSLNAQLVSAKLDYDRAVELKKRKIGKQRDVDITKAKMDDLTAKLGDAQYDLDRTEVRALSDGYVTQMLVYPGLYVVPMPLRPAMVFVQHDSFAYIGWYRQNSAMRLKAGFEAEIAFDALPGKVFTGEVVKVLPVLAEGEVQANGTMIRLGLTGRIAGRIPVQLKITDPRFAEFAQHVPGGSYGQSAIYSDSFAHVSIMRKIILRMSSWMSYFFPFH